MPSPKPWPRTTNSLPIWMPSLHPRGHRSTSTMLSRSPATRRCSNGEMRPLGRSVRLSRRLRQPLPATTRASVSITSAAPVGMLLRIHGSRVSGRRHARHQFDHRMHLFDIGLRQTIVRRQRGGLRGGIIQSVGEPQSGGRFQRAGRDRGRHRAEESPLAGK